MILMICVVVLVLLSYKDASYGDPLLFFISK